MRRTMMKMASASSVFLLLLGCSIVIPADSDGRCDRFAAVGADVVVPLNSKMKDPYRLTWRQNTNLLFTRRGEVIDPGKPDDVDPTGSLKLKNVTVQQSGNYTPQVYDRDRRAESDLKTTVLCVIEPVLKPSVESVCEDSNSNVKFTCLVHKKDQPRKKDITVVWSRNKKFTGKKNDWSVRFSAKTLGKDVVICNVSNQVSFELSDQVAQTCYKPFLPDEVFGVSIWVFVGSGAGIVVLLIVMVVICCIRTRRMKRMRLKDEGELRLQWSNTAHHHHHHQHGHASNHSHHHHQHPHPHHHQQQQQQPAGSTGPRPSRSRQQRDQQRDQQRGHLPKPPSNGQPLPSPRRGAERPKQGDDGDAERPPPLPQPRKKAPRAQRV